MVRDQHTGALKPFRFDNIIEEVPELKKFGFSLSSCSFNPPMDSSNINPRMWIKLAEIIEVNYNRFDGFIILHGTDTMAYSASALSFMLENLGKPVIFTGSQLPLGSIRTDGKENLISALRTNNLYPPGIYAEKIADAVKALYATRGKDSEDLFFDDLELLSHAKEPQPRAAAEPEDEQDEDMDELLEDDFESDFDENDDQIKKLDSSLKIADDDFGDTTDES